MKNVIEVIATFAQANVVFHPDVKGTVTMHLLDVPWDEALKAAVAAVGGAVIVETGSIYRVAASKPASLFPAAGARKTPAGKLLVQLHDVRDLVGSHGDLVDRVRALSVDDVRMQADTLLVVRAVDRKQRAVAALLAGLRREQVMQPAIDELKAEMKRLGDELDRLRAEVDALKKNR